MSEPREIAPEEPEEVRAPDDPPPPPRGPERGAETVADLEIPPGARTIRNLRDRRRVIE